MGTAAAAARWRGAGAAKAVLSAPNANRDTSSTTPPTRAFSAKALSQAASHARGTLPTQQSSAASATQSSISTLLTLFATLVPLIISSV